MSLSPIDAAHLAAATEGDTTLARELLALFAELLREHLPELARGPAAGRSARAHGLRGAAVAVGAERLAAVLQLIEASDDAAPLPRGLAEDLGREGSAAQNAAETLRAA